LSRDFLDKKNQAILPGASGVWCYLSVVNRDELLQAYADGRRDFSGVNLFMAFLRGANLEGVNLRGAYLEGAHLEGVHLGNGARFHRDGVWTQIPPRCAAGDWWAICIAPGVVRIGCTTLSIDDWLGNKGELLANMNKVSPMDRHVLHTWLTMLADIGNDIPGWKADQV
jgi:hypothetical protein